MDDGCHVLGRVAKCALKLVARRTLVTLASSLVLNHSGLHSRRGRYDGKRWKGTHTKLLTPLSLGRIVSYLFVLLCLSVPPNFFFLKPQACVTLIFTYEKIKET